MWRHFPLTFAGLLLLVLPSTAVAGEYTLKTQTRGIPNALSESISKLFGEQAIQLLDVSGNVIAEVWFRKEVPSKATAEQLKNGLTLQEIDESTILAVVRFEQPGSDYRQQKIQPGVYTLRLGFQPMDGDHAGTAPYPNFGILVPAKADTKPEAMGAKELQEFSKKASGSSHPAVFLIYPNEKPNDAAKLVDKGNGVWVINTKLPVTAAGQTSAIGIGLTLIGHGEG